MAAIDVQRLLETLLPPGKRVESVTMVDVYTAVIDGEEYSCQVEIGSQPGPVAGYFASLVTTPAADNAALEGAEIEEPPPEEEHDPEASHKRGKSKHGRR